MLAIPANARVALYARISTNGDRQHLENQLRELRKYCKRQRWKIVEEFTDQVSGGIGKQRPGLDTMMEGATRKNFDVLLIYDLSRLTRGGPATAFAVMERLTNAGVALWSLREEFFRTPVAGPILFAVAAYFAEYERESIRARVKAGIDRARSQGVTLGRPKVDDIPTAELLTKRAAGWSLRKLAAHFKCSKTTVQRKIDEIGASGVTVSVPKKKVA